MKKFLCVFFLLFFISVQAGSLRLLDNIRQAQVGDYVVISENRQYTLLVVQKIDHDKIFLDEISISESQFKDLKLSFKKWMEKKAPQHTSWVTYLLNLNDGKLLKGFSWDSNCYFNPQPDLFQSLLTINYEEIPLKERRKIGHQDDLGPDNRKIWQPPLYLEGKKIDSAFFTAYKAQWPNDGTELAGKTIEIYFPKNIENAPNYFPFWLNVKGTASLAKTRLIDSGRGMICSTHGFTKN